MKNDLGMSRPRWAEATRSVHGIRRHGDACGLRSESVPTDFHELRQGRYAAPPIREGENNPRLRTRQTVFA